MGQVIPFKKPKESLPDDPAVSKMFMALAMATFDKSKYWSHICPSMGLIGMLVDTCDYCGKTKEQHDHEQSSRNQTK